MRYTLDRLTHKSYITINKLQKDWYWHIIMHCKWSTMELTVQVCVFMPLRRGLCDPATVDTLWGPPPSEWEGDERVLHLLQVLPMDPVGNLWWHGPCELPMWGGWGGRGCTCECVCVEWVYTMIHSYTEWLEGQSSRDMHAVYWTKTKSTETSCTYEHHHDNIFHNTHSIKCQCT